MGNTANLQKNYINAKKRGRGTKGINILRLNFGKANGDKN